MGRCGLRWSGVVVVRTGDGLQMEVVMQGRSTPVERGERAAFRFENDAPVVFD